MELEHKTTEQLEQMITNAREQEQAAKAALHVNDRRVYADDVHAERVKAIETERRQSIDAVTAEVQRRVSEIDEQLLPTDRDPLLGLAPDELTRASALAVFVREDIAAGNVEAKVRAVIRSGDKAAQAVWLRYLIAPDQRWTGDVAQLVEQLEAIVRPHDPRHDELRAKQEALQSIQLKEATTGYLERTYGRR